MGRAGKRLSDQNRNVVSVRITDEELEELQGLMTATSKSVSELLKEAFRTYIEQYPLPEDAHLPERTGSEHHDTFPR
ncbi:MAG: CopG family transcriptional regulator [Desulfuromonadales bacterium]|nr:MAG: CopG family transcriptional regulator [Desulfuromonadales bacterium]